LIDAHEGYAQDYDRLGDVHGKAVLVHRELRDWPQTQITEAAYRGASAIVFYDYPNSGDQLDTLRQDSMWGHEQIAAVAVSRRSARTLAAALAAGPVTVGLESRADVSDGHSQNVIGVLHGTELPDEWVVVSAHYDRWFQGAGDNTSGVAAVLEIARAFVGSGLRPRRSMIFMTTGGEEAGLEDPERDWLAGSHSFVTRHPEILRRAALVFNVDLIGWTSPSATLMSSPDIVAQQKRVLADLGYDTKISLTIPMTSALDAWNYGVVGGAAMNHLWRATFTGSPAYFPIYHTQLDTFQPEHFANLPMDLRLLSLSLWRAATVARLPIALTAIADYVGPELAKDAEKVRDVDFSSAQAALADFRQAAAAVEASQGLVPVNDVNRILMSVRHTLVPWLYISNGDFEQAVRTAEYAERVAVLDRVVTALRKADRDGAQAALRQIYEGRLCLHLSGAVYARERDFWAGAGGWATEFEQRPTPPGPAFAAGCALLRETTVDAQRAAAEFLTARGDGAQSVSGAIALMAAKLLAATEDLRRFVAVHGPAVATSRTLPAP
ncbi:MAG TPA: M28 family metallopeptidase, partial [Steroidobacteraceae bacterium]